MSQWNRTNLLQHAQMLVGMHAGDLYNFELWSVLLNQAQNDAVARSYALNKSGAEFPYDPTVAFEEPADFLDFSFLQPKFKAANGVSYALEVISQKQLEEKFPTWRESNTTATPTCITEYDFHIHPKPAAAGTLILPYVFRPRQINDDNDVPFNGLSRYDRFAEMLPYYIASKALLVANPQAAGSMWTIYERQLRQLKEFVREKVQSTNYVRTLKDEKQMMWRDDDG